MLIYFARHGQTDHNLQGFIQGQLDTRLNEVGREESRLLAAHLADVPFTTAWSSDLSRAMETAQIVTKRHGLPIQTHPLLRERGLGSLEGHRWLRGTPLPADVEKSADFRARVAEWFAHLLAVTPEDATVLVVSHGAYLSTLLGILLSPPYSLPSPGVDLAAHCLNTCVARVKLTKGEKKWQGQILSWGEITHLGDKAVDIGVADDLRRDAQKVSS